MWESIIMYKQCNSEITAKRQRNLENWLLELMQTTAYEKITVGDLCTAANVPRGMFYRYFDSKKDALDALIDHTLLEYMTTISLAEDNQWEDPLGIQALLVYWKSQKSLLDVLKRNHLESVLFERSIRYCTVEEQILSRHLMLAGNPADLEVAAFCVNGVLSAFFVWYESGFAKPTEEMARILRKLLTGPVVRAG